MTRPELPDTNSAGEATSNVSFSGVVIGKILVSGYVYSNESGYPADNQFLQFRQPNLNNTRTEIVFTVRRSLTDGVPIPILINETLVGATVNPNTFAWLIDLARQDRTLLAEYSFSPNNGVFKFTVRQSPEGR